jgi:hypothetical protein
MTIDQWSYRFGPSNYGYGHAGPSASIPLPRFPVAEDSRLRTERDVEKERRFFQSSQNCYVGISKKTLRPLTMLC